MIIWDKTKNEKLKNERGITFEQIAKIILRQEYIAIIEHPSRPEQRYMIVFIKDYTHVVPLIYTDSGNFILKTIFPSRKHHKIYGPKKNPSRSGGTMD